MRFPSLVTTRTVTGATLLCIATAAGAGEIRHTYRFDEPRIVRFDSGFTRISFPSTVQGGRAGEPSFPFRGAELLLPPGEAVSRVRIHRRGWTVIKGRYRLHPRQHPMPGIEHDGGAKGLLCNEAAYAADSWVHPPASEFSTHFCRGHAIAVGSFSPVGYRPAAGTVGYHREIEVLVETAARGDALQALGLLRTGHRTRRDISRLVDNPDLLARYAPAATPLQEPGDQYEYLIVTTDSAACAFEPLRRFHTRRGMRSEIMTVQHIEATYPGADTPDKIRAAITGEYRDHGITYVLLGGDGDIIPGSPCYVPYRGLYCAVQSSQFYEDENIPADLYYAALDGDWNTDGDSLWGEPGEADLYGEVAVGRAPVDSPNEIAHLIAKTVSYQESPRSAEARTALLLGEQLWDDPLTYGGDELDQLVGACSAYGFSTEGIPADFDITTYYDRDMGSWESSHPIDAINAGINWIVHTGHSNNIYVMRLNIWQITDTVFTNNGSAAGFPLVYSYGCLAGAFDNDDSIGEEMVCIGHCAAAFIGNSRYGWFTEGTTNGPSHHFQREFYDAVFTEGITTLGAANQRSKEETVPFIDLPAEYEPGAHRWCFYDLNLLGDPALDGWTDTPQPLGASHASRIGRNDTIFAIETTTPSAIASLYHEGICFGRGVSDRSGHIYLTLPEALPDTLSSIELNVCAHNRTAYRDTLLIVDTTGGTGPVPPITLEQNVPNPFNPATAIRFVLPARGLADLRVYDVSGREVDRLLHGELPGGGHTVVWRPDHLPSGLYFYVLQTGDARIARKAILLR